MTLGSVILMLVYLLGALGIFMFGMKVLGEGLEKTAGNKLKILLQAMTRNRFLSMLCGILITVLVQSSTATTVMVVGFVNADMLSLIQAIGVIMGANIGTTVTPLLLSLEGVNFGMLFAFFGLVLSSFPKKKKQFRIVREFGPIVMGIGLLFIGMKGMSDAMVPMREWDGFKTAIQSISNPILGVLIGAVICIVLNSSAASVGLLQALAGQGLIPLSTAIYILFGQNIGTCLTSLIAGSGTSTAARRTSIVHLLFNTIGTVLFVTAASLVPFADWIRMAIPGDDPGTLKLQIALVHIVFNIVTTLVLFPAARLLEKLACFLRPEKATENSEMRLRYFDGRLLNTPPIAVAQIKREVERMGDMALKNYNAAFSCFESWDDITADEVNATEDVLDYLNREIADKLSDINGLDLSDEDSHLVGRLFHVINDLERVGDHAENILDAARLKQDGDVKFTPKVLGELQDMYGKVNSQLEKALDLFHDQKADPEVLSDVEEAEAEIDTLTETLRNHHVDRLKNKKCSARNGMIYLDMLTNLERIGDHAENIATSFSRTPDQAVLPA